MRISRKLRLLAALVFFFFVLYPNPLVLVRSIEHISHPAVDPAAVASACEDPAQRPAS